MSQEPGWQMLREENVIIRHYGYDPVRLPEKRKRGISIMKSYVKNHPEDWNTLTMLGSACGGIGNYDDAEVYLRKALEINPNYPVAYYSLGLTLERMNKPDEAIQCFTKALADPLLKAESCVCLGGIYFQKGKLDKTISELRKALEINPELASARDFLAKVEELKRS